MRTAQGFTLIEVMIAVAIVAILAAIAVPSYRTYIERANRSVAKTALSEVVSRQSSHYTDRKRYATGLAKLGWAADTLYLDRDGKLTASSGSQSIYELKLEGNPVSTTCPPGGSAAAGGFTVVARPVNSQASDLRCTALCLSSAGLKGASGSDAQACWQR